MTQIFDVVPFQELSVLIETGYVRQRAHPDLPLSILNYTQRCQYDHAWTNTSRACRGLIYNTDTMEVVARPWPKFHNYGEHEDGTLDMDAPCYVTDKMDGSLGILYPTFDGCAIATRGSFESEQAIHATELLRERYPTFSPRPGLTYLFEIIYADNRVVLDYGDMDDLVLLGVLDTETGLDYQGYFHWPGPFCEIMPGTTLADALALPPRPNAEGVVVTYLTGLKVKIKQDDYVALHRIMTHLNARNVWEVAAVRACAHIIHDAKHWGSFLGIDPARAEEVIALEDGWLDGVPDEFFGWVSQVMTDAQASALATHALGLAVAERGGQITDRQQRFEYVKENAGAISTEVMRLASSTKDDEHTRNLDKVKLRAWREACPDPTAPFARSEDIA